MKKSSNLMSTAFIAILVIFAGNVKAQTTAANTFNLGFGIETGLPTGVARIGTNFTLGGTARLQYGISNSFALTLTTGGYHFFPKMIPGSAKRYQSYGEIPVKVGIKEFFVPNIYIGAEIGSVSEKLEHGWGPTRLDLSPALGYANQHWDFGVHYERFSRQEDNFGVVNLRIAYGFQL